MRRALLLLGAWFVGCGSSVTGPGEGGGGASASSTTSQSTSSTASSTSIGEWTDCSTPEGYRICGGPAACDPAACETQCDQEFGCAECVFFEPPIAAICGTGKMIVDDVISDCYLCPDGKVCIDFSNDQYIASCVPYNMGKLYADAGNADSVRYADLSLFTGEPLPEPTTCPTFDGFPICGGNCGGCPPERVCTGRSPRHPYGICAPHNSCAPSKEIWCGAGQGCFVWTVEPEAQELADQSGYCYLLATCQAMAAELPGGGKCHVP